MPKPDPLYCLNYRMYQHRLGYTSGHRVSCTVSSAALAWLNGIAKMSCRDRNSVMRAVPRNFPLWDPLNVRPPMYIRLCEEIDAAVNLSSCPVLLPDNFSFTSTFLCRSLLIRTICAACCRSNVIQNLIFARVLKCTGTSREPGGAACANMSMP